MPTNDYDRLIRWLQTNYPPSDYSRSQIRYWMRNNLPCYEHLKPETKKDMMKDWENFTIYEKRGDKQMSIVRDETKMKSWLGRLSDGLKNIMRKLLRR